jgi:hypothetical protein
MALKVMALDMLEIDCLGDARGLEQSARIVPQVRVIDDPAQIAFEMGDIDRVIAQQRGKQPPIGFGDVIAAEESARR